MKPTFYLLLAILFTACSTEQIQYINDVNGTRPIGPYAHATASGQIVFTSGQLGLDPENNELESGIENQTKRALDNLKSVLMQSGSDMDHVLKTTIYLADITHFAQVNKIYANYFDYVKPARTTLQVAALPRNALIEIECVAVKWNGEKQSNSRLSPKKLTLVGKR